MRENLQKARKKLGLTQQAMAEKLGISSAIISRSRVETEPETSKFGIPLKTSQVFIKGF